MSAILATPKAAAIDSNATTGVTGTAASATIRTLIAERARLTPDKAFVLIPGDPTALSFAQLHADCLTLERRFAAAGLETGEIVSLFMGNGALTVRLLFGIMFSGLVVNPINLLCQPSQTRYIVSHADCRLLFVAPEHADAMRTVVDALRASTGRVVELVVADPASHALPSLPALTAHRDLSGNPGDTGYASVGHGVKGGDQYARAAPPPAAHASPNDPAEASALLMYTSGTTGVPKGVLLTQRNLLVNAANISAEHRLGPDDRVLVSLPLYHINALVVALLSPLVHGGSLVMPARFSASTFWQDAAAYRCSWLNLVPTILAYLLNAPEDGSLRTLDLSALKFCRSASSALPPEHHRAFEARFALGVIETMGMTETAAPVFSNPYDPDARKVGSIGLPSGAEARIIGKDGAELGAFDTGELVLRGAMVMHGYYKRPVETAAAFTADGWLRTGDLGYRDADGFFFINGRAKELIIKGGENIAPREIDEALLKHPGVLEAAAVGVPDDAYGQDIIAYVVKRASASVDSAALHAHCLGELGRYKTPREFRFVAELPRGPSGKVQRLKLLEL